MVDSAALFKKNKKTTVAKMHKKIYFVCVRFNFRVTGGNSAGLDTLLILYLLNVEDGVPSLRHGDEMKMLCRKMGPENTKIQLLIQEGLNPQQPGMYSTSVRAFPINPVGVYQVESNMNVELTGQSVCRLNVSPV